MPARPQNSPRGLFSKRAISIVASDGTVTALTGNSTGVVADRGLTLTGTFKITGTSRVLTANSTGVKLGSRYISTNTTGNVTT